MESGHQKIARAAAAIAREYASGPIRAMRSRRQPQDQQSRARITESGHRPGPIGLVPERPSLLAANVLTVLAQSGTIFTFDDRAVNLSK